MAAAYGLPVRRDATATLRDWGSRLRGFDIVPEFVDAARLRIALLARVRAGGEVDPASLPNLLPGIRVADGLRPEALTKSGGLVLMNPPFGLMAAPNGHAWMRGKVAKAAVFVERWISDLDENGWLVAILPDVIRSGSRYARLRTIVAASFVDVSITPLGRFDNTTDVDVFALVGRRAAQGGGPIAWWPEGTGRGEIASAFDVHVGAIVAYRDGNKDAKRAFIQARELGPWTIHKRITSKWGAGPRVVQPPFVAVRRTSSPSDKHRAVAAVVAGRRPVAVENHLLTLVPRSGRLADAVELMKWLGSPEVDRLLQLRIRCRHLTVASLASLPLPGRLRSR
ncbi:MAG TPA: hypothetical protein VIN70_05465 [Candidatus Limnocylindria bacterium]